MLESGSRRDYVLVRYCKRQGLEIRFTSGLPFMFASMVGGRLPEARRPAAAAAAAGETARFAHWAISRPIWSDDIVVARGDRRDLKDGDVVMMCRDDGSR